MNTFIFQSLPELFDLREKLNPGLVDTWYASRYRNEMKVNDIVFFWMGGDERFKGLYGYGKIVKEPYLEANSSTYGVDVEYQVKFKKPITSSFIRNDSDLKNLLIMRAPQATNFLVDDVQSKKLLKIIREHGEDIPKLV